MNAAHTWLLACLCFASAAAQEVTWPQAFSSADGMVVHMYQPQIESLSANRLSARAAVAVLAGDAGGDPVFGAIWMTAYFDADRDTRIARLRDVSVTQTRIADAQRADVDHLIRSIEQSLGNTSIGFSVEQIVADLDLAGLQQREPELSHDAPRIVIAEAPALLVSVDGDPVFRRMAGSPYERVVNTPFKIFKDGNANYLYIGSDTWYIARNVLGPWLLASSVPAAMRRSVGADADNNDPPPVIDIVVATEPTELIVYADKPAWTAVPHTHLMYMNNTGSRVFLDTKMEHYYVLLSGRWYRNDDLHEIPGWRHVPNDALPAQFADLPVDSPMSGVLSHVAGTNAARDAVLDNSIPQTAAIDRRSNSFSVHYDGEPDFVAIDGVPVEYARNTNAAVFRHGDDYYACDRGVWFHARSATGPWTVATTVAASIYEIPASHRHHNVTYVRVYDRTPEYVHVGYTPGYLGSYNYGGSVVYGSGWRYPSWYGGHYYPRNPTWGLNAHYDALLGWRFGVAWIAGAFLFDAYGHNGWWGVGGYRPYRRQPFQSGYRQTETQAAGKRTYRTSGLDTTRPNLYVTDANKLRLADSARITSTRRARPVKNSPNDVLTDRFGNVYRRDTDGTWSQRDHGRWRSATAFDRTSPSPPDGAQLSDRDPSPPAYTRHYGTGQYSVRPQLERDHRARERGGVRSQR